MSDAIDTARTDLDTTKNLHISLKDLREIGNYAQEEFKLELPRGLNSQELQIFLILKGFSGWAKKHGIALEVTTKR